MSLLARRRTQVMSGQKHVRLLENLEFRVYHRLEIVYPSKWWEDIKSLQKQGHSFFSYNKIKYKSAEIRL